MLSQSSEGGFVTSVQKVPGWSQVWWSRKFGWYESADLHGSCCIDYSELGVATNGADDRIHTVKLESKLAGIFVADSNDLPAFGSKSRAWLEVHQHKARVSSMKEDLPVARVSQKGETLWLQDNELYTAQVHSCQ